METDIRIENTVRSWPKIELHCHLDGSLSLPLIKRLAIQEGIEMPEGEAELTKYLQAPVNCKSLKEYLEPFGRVAFCMQRAEFLEEAAFDCLSQAAEDGVIYQEIRFAPAFSLGKGMSMEEAVCAVANGMKKAEKVLGIKSRMILCMMRGRPLEENEKVTDAFLNVRERPEGEFLGGLDLAGDEAAYPPGQYEKLFSRARKEEIPFTIHAGECGCPDNIRTAVRMGAVRIGHGIAARFDNEVIRLLEEFQVVLEMCPTSNYQTKALGEEEVYPLKDFLKRRLKVTVSTDNRTVSGTTLTREYEWLLEHFPHLGAGDFRKMNEDALEGAFLAPEEKAKLWTRLIEGYQD